MITQGQIPASQRSQLQDFPTVQDHFAIITAGKKNMKLVERRLCSFDQPFFSAKVSFEMRYSESRLLIDRKETVLGTSSYNSVTPRIEGPISLSQGGKTN